MQEVIKKALPSPSGRGGSEAPNELKRLHEDEVWYRPGTTAPR